MVYKNYKLTLGNNTTSYTFLYELEQHRPAQEWAQLIAESSVDTLRKNFNPWAGSVSNVKRIDASNRLVELINLLNQWIPDKIETLWDSNDFQNSLNKLHIHFPELERTETDPVKLDQLSEYNTTIHLLEHLYRNQHVESIMLILLPHLHATVDLTDDEYLLFDPNVKFGEMVLHYPLVGRNAFELLKAKDYTCPVEQVKPQHVISPYHHLRFFDDPTDTESYRKQFKDFYEKSTIKEKYKIDDPKLAFGFIKLGKLVSTLDRGEILNIVRSCDKVISWKIT